MAFSLKAVFGIDGSGVRTELRQLLRELNSFVQDFAKLGAGAAVGAFVAFSKGALDLASSLKDTALQVGINVEKLQALHYAATQNGSSVETMNKALEKLRLNTQAAASGSKEQAAAFAQLGLNIQQMLALPLEQRYEAVAKAVRNSTDKQAAYNAVSEIFGNKIGPDQIAVLDALAADGFPKVAKAAAAAGQVMSAETVVALERAQQAIENFKKQATVAVGDILVNFRSEEGLQLLGLRLLKAAAGFGGKILDALSEANDLIGSVFTGTFTGVANWLRDKLVDAAKALSGALNAVLPERFEINVAGLDQFRSSGEYVAASITRAIAETKPSTFQRDFTAFWDDAVKKQEAVVKQLNNTELKKDADAIRNAGKSLQQSGEATGDAIKKGADDAAKKLEEAAAKAAAQYESAAQSLASKTGAIFDKSLKNLGMLGSLSGRALSSMDDATIEEILRRARAESSTLSNPALTPGFDNLANQFQRARVDQEILNAQRELDIRNRFRQDVSLYGVDRARQMSPLDPEVFAKLLQQIGPGADEYRNRQLNELEKISDGTANLNRSFGALSAALFHMPPRG